MARNECRFCASPLRSTLIDLGVSPLANSYLKAEQLNQMEPFYPLRLYLCEECFLFQLQEYESPAAIFSNYAYFSSFSDTWLKHARSYAEMAIDRFGLNPSHQVIEIASNDGYLLQYFVPHRIRVLGIEPASNVAQAAVRKGIPTLVKFFGQSTAVDLVREGRQADLLIGNNVLAHVPNLNDFVQGLKTVLSPGGVMTLEFPHLMRLIEENQFDTIYHEHFSYFSLNTVERALNRWGLAVFDVEELPTHGGSLRIFAGHAENRNLPRSPRVSKLKAQERAAGLLSISPYLCFAERIKSTKRALLEFLIGAKKQGRSIVAYGAPAKGNTLLNYCGIGADFIDYAVDRNPEKQNHYLPGTHIRILSPEKLRETKPDFLLILPWNLKDEIMEQMAHVRDWNCQFVVPIPEIRVLA